MIHRSLVTGFWVLWLSTHLAAWESEPATLRVLSYNIHHAAGVDGRLDAARIAAVILTAEPDLVALQEVDQGTRRVHLDRQADTLGRLTGMHVVFGPNLSLEGGDYGNALLSRWPLTTRRNVHLPSQDGGEPRGALIVELEWPEPGRVLRVMATHWDHRLADGERFASARRMNELALERPGVPSLLVGDLNTTRDTRVIEQLIETWTVAGNEPTPTIPVANPVRQIDYVLYRPADAWRVVNVFVLHEDQASDHRAIMAVLKLR